MSIKALSDYTFYSRYAKYVPEKRRRETWEEAVNRVFDMHEKFFADQLRDETFREYFEFAKNAYLRKKALGSQRALQFGGEPILRKHMRMFNCSTTHVNRPRVFQEAMWVLLCGTGLGFSVQKHHIHQLPKLLDNHKGDVEKVTHVCDDSIEGWADAIGIIVNSFFSKKESAWPEYSGKLVKFDYSQIRPEGAFISGGFKAPGPKGLERSLEAIRSIIQKRLSSDEFKTDEFAGKLRPIDCFDIICLSADAVLSGGVRRSALLTLFSHDDEEMASAKTGDWFIKHAHRGRSNNSAALNKKTTTREEFAKLMKSTREFGEPGFVWVDDDDMETVYNPCCEIAMIPITEDGEHGVQVCNLTEINGKYCSSEEKFLEACKASAIIGTMQAAYTDFNYLTEASKRICDREALLGCSITGLNDNPEILLNPDIQCKGAKLIKQVNEEVAKLLGINKSARTTCVKPAGSTSCLLQTASGIHPHHAKRYLRRVQANKNEFPLQFFKGYNPLAIEESVWSTNKTDEVITFVCEVPDGAKTKNQLSALDLLDQVKLTQQNWVTEGTNLNLGYSKRCKHNVSNTITVLNEQEWLDVEDYIWKNRKWFAGISLLPASGDLDYAQAPFATVLTPTELVREYGDASVFASGLIVDGLSAFEDNLWRGCDTVLGFGEELEDELDEPQYPKNRNYKALSDYFSNQVDYEKWFSKKDWVRRVNQFAERYFEGDVRRATYCLKHVSLWKTYCDLRREYIEVDWSQAVEENEEYVNVDTLAAQACAGGKCEIM